MEGQALISQREYSTVKTMYALAIFFCVVAFLYPLSMFPSPDLYTQETYSMQYFIIGYFGTLLTCSPSIFLIFCILFAKGTKRGALISVGLFIFAFYLVANQTINIVNYLNYIQSDAAVNQGNDLGYSQIHIWSSVRPYIRMSIYIVFAFVFYRKYKTREIKPATKNLLFVLLFVWTGTFIYNWLLFYTPNLSISLVLSWLWFIVCVALLCWLFYRKTRPVQHKNKELLDAFIVLLVALFAILIAFTFAPGNVLLKILSLVYDFLPFYFMYIVYKSIADYGFHPLFIESNPRGFIRAKQFAPAQDDSVLKQFITLMHKAFWKNSD